MPRRGLEPPRPFERRHLKQLSTVEDLDLVCEIGFHQEQGQPLSIKQLYLLNLASVATIQRRLRQAVGKGVVEQVAGNVRLGVDPGGVAVGHRDDCRLVDRELHVGEVLGACIQHIEDALAADAGRLRGRGGRPALSGVFPTQKGTPVVVVDVGANVDCLPEMLAQFGVMGEIYSRLVLRINQPRVGILSIGEEDHKGNNLTRDAVVVLRDGFTGDDAMIATLVDHAKSKLARYKFPRIVRFVASAAQFGKHFDGVLAGHADLFDEGVVIAAQKRIGGEFLGDRGRHRGNIPFTQGSIALRAPGQRGMVMVVFTLPGLDVVFKVIRDRFPPPKTVTHILSAGRPYVFVRSSHA